MYFAVFVVSSYNVQCSKVTTEWQVQLQWLTIALFNYYVIFALIKVIIAIRKQYIFMHI